MMDINKNHIESFYKIYKKSLDDIIPDTSMQCQDWEIISSHLPDGKKKKKPVYFWWVAASLLVFIAIPLFKKDKNTSSKCDEITKNRSLQKSDRLVKISSTIQDPSKDNTTSINSQPQKSTQIKNGYSNHKNDLTYNQNISSVKKNKDNIYSNMDFGNGSLINNLTENQMLANSLKIPYLKSTDSLNLKSTVKFGELATQDKVLDIDYLTPSSFTPIPLALAYTFTQKPLNTLSNIEERMHWLGRLSVGKYYERNHLESSIPLHPTTISESLVSSKNGNQLGIYALVQPNNKCRFGIGLKYTSFNFETSHKALIGIKDIDYHSTSSDNIKKYNYQYDLYDGSTRSTVRISLFEVNTNQTLDINDTFKMDMTLLRSISHIQLPISVERRLINIKNLSLYGKMGASIALSTKIKNSLSHHNENCKELCFVNGFEPEVISSPVNSMILSTNIGLGIEYKISPLMSLGINPEISIHPNHNYTSWLHQQSLGLYISYKIN